MINGLDSSLYNTIDLPDVVLNAGNYYVICANNETVANCDLDVSPDTGLIQNGGPDAIALYNDGNLVDTVSYEGDTVGYTEGTGAQEDQGASSSKGLSRYPDGKDTNNNSADFAFICITPGSENIDCDGDNDDDGVINSRDNCINTSNPDQLDGDEDGVGDACDNCPSVANADQADADINGVGDVCEEGGGGGGPVDTDSDGIPDDSDNCPTVSNSGQEDGDGDEIGDACDIGVLAPELVSPTETLVVYQNTPFTFTSKVTCNNGVCGDTTATLDPISSYIGSYRVSDGPHWYSGGVLSYSGIEACALLFGGDPEDYHTSTNGEDPNLINYKAWLDGYGDTTYCGTPADETFKKSEYYDCGYGSCSFSAYVSDHGCSNVNYCFLAAKGTVSTTVGDQPFYTTSQNPQTKSDVSCLENIQAGTSCEQSWSVMPTGKQGRSYKFFTIYDSSLAGQATTTEVSVKIYCDDPDDNGVCADVEPIKVVSAEAMASDTVKITFNKELQNNDEHSPKPEDFCIYRGGMHADMTERELNEWEERCTRGDNPVQITNVTYADKVAILTLGEDFQAEDVPTYEVLPPTQIGTIIDTFGNELSEILSCSIVDKIVPVVTLNGDSVININVGGSYSEQGATAYDIFDGDLTDSVSTVGTVDTATAGTYTITYSATDEAENTGTATRTINVNQQGGGSVAIYPCTDVVYSDWGVCANGMQHRSIISQSPNFCNLTYEQQSAGSRSCASESGSSSGSNGSNQEEEPNLNPLSLLQQKMCRVNPHLPECLMFNGRFGGVGESGQVLGVKFYPDGSLLRSTETKKIYYIIEGKKKHIKTFIELWKYRGIERIDVSEEVLAQYPDYLGDILGIKAYPDNSLLRSILTKKIYYIMNAEKKYIPTLAELWKYRGIPIINVVEEILAQYPDAK